MIAAQELSGSKELGKAERERHAIMRAAQNLIGQDGTRLTTIEDVLHAAKVNRRIFYRHFRSKDDLVLAMLEHTGETVAAGLQAVVIAAETPAAGVAAYIDHLLRIGWDQRRARDGRGILSHEVGQTAGIAGALEDVYARQRLILHDVLVRGRADGSLPDAVPDRDAFAIQAVVIRYLEMRVRGRLEAEFADLRDSLTTLFLRALGAPLGPT
jgi:AcrR family transcriptional regulator